MKSIFLVWALLPFYAFSQSKIPVSPNLRDDQGKRTGHWTILCDSLFRETHNIDSVRYFRQARFENGKPVGMLRDYYLSGRKQWEGICLDIFPDVFGGEYRQYHENGQLYVWVNYVNNKQNGPKKVYYPNGKLQFEYSLKNDSINGKYIQYYESGGKQFEMMYKDDKANGLYMSYYPEGNLEIKLYYKDNLIDGNYIRYHPNGKIATLGIYKIGQFFGNWKYFYANGNIETEGKYLEDGIKTGLWKFYNEDGVQNGLRPYVKGKLMGLSIDFYPDKKVQNKGKYINDLRDSIWNYYYPSGKLQKRGGFIADTAEGKWEYFYESGKVDQIGYFKKGSYDSLWTMYLESGKVKSITRYKNNKVNGYSMALQPNGNMDFDGSYTDGEFDGYFKIYHENGKLKTEGLYIMGKRNGIHKKYHDNGQLKEEVNYIDDKYNGNYKKYYANGKLEEETFYTLDKKNGIYRDYHENGNLKIETSYSNDNKEGSYKKYYENGIQETDGTYIAGLANGIFTYRYDNGRIYSQGKYENDFQEGIWLWYHDTGELKNQETYKKGQFYGEYICYYKNGNVKFKGLSINGQKNGYYKGFDSLGVKITEGQYANGLQEGKWVDYYPKSGKKQIIYSYQKNKYHGKYTYFYEDKSEPYIAYYVNGFKENSDNISDSIITLRNIQDYKGALKATKWLEQVIKRDFKIPERQTIATYQYANIYYETKNYDESLKWWKIYRDNNKKYYGDTVNNYAVALSGIALNLTELKRYDESLVAHDEALAAFEKTVGRFSNNYLIVLNNKTRIYTDLKQYDKKEKVLLDEMAIREKTFPKNSVEVWKIYKYLAIFYYDNDKYPESIKYYQKIKNGILDAFLAEDKPSANGADSLKNSIDGLLKTLDQAQKQLDGKPEDVKKAKEFYPNDTSYPFYRAASIGLTKCYDETSEYRKAIVELNKFINESQYWSIVTPFEKAENYNDLANFYRKAGVKDTSEQLFEQVLANAKQNNWEENDIIKEANWGLANLAYSNGDYAKASEYYGKVKDFLESIGFSGTNSYANLLKSNAISLYNQDKKYAPYVLSYYRRASQIKKEIFGIGSQTYLETALKTSEVYTWNFKYNQSDSVLNELEKPIIDNFGKAHYLYIYYLEYKASNLFAQSNFKEAIPFYEKAVEHYKTQKEQQDSYASYLAQISTCYNITGEKAKAKTYLLQAIEIYKKDKGVDNETYLIYRNIYASILDDEGLKVEAEKIYREVALSCAKIYGVKSYKYAKMQRDLGFFYFNNANYEKSLLAYEKSKEILTELKDKNSDDYISTLLEIGKSQEYLGKYELAEQTTSEAAKPIETRYGKSSLKYADLLKRFASIYLSQKLYDKALKNSMEAVRIVRSILGNEGKETADFQKQLANIYSQMDNNKGAEELYVQNIRIYENIVGKNNNYYQGALNDLYQFYVSFGQYTEAEKIVDEDIAITRQINENDKLGYANKLSKKGNLLISWKKYAQADSLFRQILKIREGELAENDPNVITTRNQLGICALQMGKTNEAEGHFNFCVEQMELKKDTISINYANFKFNLGTVNLYKSNFGLAEKQYKTGLNIYKKNYKSGSIEEINLLDNLAALYQAWNKYEPAEKYWLEVTSKLLKYIQTNFYFLSDREKAQFWLKNKDIFESFNTFAILRSGQNPQILGTMYNYQLSTKAILLSASNKIKKRILSSPDSSVVQNYYQWVALKESLSNAYIMSEEERKTKKINLPALEAEANKLEKNMNITTEEVSAEDQTKTISWREIQKTLTGEEAVIEIVRMRYFDKKLTDSIIYTALVLTSETKTNPMVVMLPDGRKLEKSYLSYYKNAIALKLDDENSYQSYWAAINEKLKNKTQLYVSLDGVYNSINLQSLLMPSGKYLLEEKNIKIVSNSKDVILFKTVKKQHSSRQTAVLLGFPKYFIGKSNASKSDVRSLDDIDRSGISELPGTKTEIEKVNAILTGTQWESKNYLGEEASEMTLKAIRNPRILHIATHGFFVDPSQKNEFKGKGMEVFSNQQNPLLRSGLLLSGAANFIQNKTTFSEENGVLTAYEAANLNLENTDLVILSACETGKGEISNGEGVYGLQRAFQAAGAKAVVMSLWKVNDTATQELMTSFYQQWMGGMDKQKAFKSAQLKLKEKYKSPYYWGAFVMVGN